MQIKMTVKCCTCPATTEITANGPEQFEMAVAASKVGWSYRARSHEFDCQVCRGKLR